METIDLIFGQYNDYALSHVILELTAIAASLVSVYYSFRNSTLLFPFGILSTLIFVYLLYEWNLLGDMVINAYYFIMSVYGWYIWLYGGQNDKEKKISLVRKSEWQVAIGILLITAAGIYGLYASTGRLEQWYSYIDMLTTGIFFAGMWLMAKRKLEHWLVLGLGNIISVPLYFFKGYSFSAILYVVLAIVAIFGFLEWKKYLNNKVSTA